MEQCHVFCDPSAGMTKALLAVAISASQRTVSGNDAPSSIRITWASLGRRLRNGLYLAAIEGLGCDQHSGIADFEARRDRLGTEGGEQG